MCEPARSHAGAEALQDVLDGVAEDPHAGAFGLCVECQAEINRKRLEAVPWASHCITCQEKIEKGLL